MLLIRAGFLTTVILSCLLVAGSVEAAVVTYSDPANDTLGVGPIQHDILSISSDVVGGDLILEVLFNGPIAPASTFLPSSIVGMIDLDLDQSAVTGALSLAGSELGVEYYLDLFTESFNPGLVQLVNATTFATITNVPIVYGANSLSLTVALSDLNGDDGLIHSGAVLGTFTEMTDTALGAPADASAVPEPGSCLVWLALGLTYLPARRLIRRRPRWVV